MNSIKSIIATHGLPFLGIGIVYAIIEHVLTQSTDPRPLWPLILRAGISGLLIGTLIRIFDLSFVNHFRKRTFLYLVLVKSVSYTLILASTLMLVNGIWQMVANDMGLLEGIADYLYSEMFVINLWTIFLLILFFSSVVQINSLHRKGELLNFISGRYHQPKEVERIFAFIDLVGSTTIAEHLGHRKFGQFLKDYYSDITEPIRNTKGEIYQYVGDEIILCWEPHRGFENNNVIDCVVGMQQTIASLSEYYHQKYGYQPRFRAGIHLGKVLVTWVGELKKEILFIGDVMNTTSRIQEDCKRLGHDLLISGEVAAGINQKNGLNLEFLEETVPRGKEKPIKLYSVERELETKH